MNGSARLAAMLASLAAVAIVSAGCGPASGNPSPVAAVVQTTPRSVPATASPSPTAAAPSAAASQDPSPSTLDTSAWKTYRSDRYGFTIGYPAGTTPVPATRDWTMVDDRTEWQTTAAEQFPTRNHSLLITAWAVPVAPRSSLETFLAAYCGDTCQALIEQAKPIDFDGHAGKLLVVPDDSVQAFALVDGTVYAVAGWHDYAEPDVRAFVSTMHIDH